MRKMLANVISVLFGARSSQLPVGWATGVDILNSELTRHVPNSIGGCVLGEVGMKAGERPLIDLSLSPVLAVGPARTGKTAGVVIPSLLRWAGSALVLDVNGERWRATHDWRERLGTNGVLRSVLRLDLSGEAEASASFNVLGEIRDYAADVEHEVQALASSLLHLPEPFWASVTRSLLSAVLLHAIYAFPRDKCALSHVAEFMGEREVDVLRRELCSVVHPQAKHVRAAMEGLGELGGEATSAARNMVLQALAGFLNPAVRAATDTSNFSIESVVAGDGPRSLYVTWNSSDTLKVRAVPKMILDFVYRRCGQIQARAHKLLIALDDFDLLDMPHGFDDKIASAPFLGIKFLVVQQTLRQVVENRGKDKVDGFLSLFPNRLFFRPAGMEEAELVTTHALNCAGSVVDRARSGGQPALEMSPGWLLREELPSEYGGKRSLLVVCGTMFVAASPKFYWQDPVYKMRASAA